MAQLAKHILDAISHARLLGADHAATEMIKTVEPSTMTYDAAIAACVEHDVARWGEAERCASERLRRVNHPTIGLALNGLAHIDPDAIDERMAAQAILAMTGADVRRLRNGG